MAITSIEPVTSINPSFQRTNLETPIRHVVRVGAVSYLNSKPLIFGLAERLADWAELSVELPSRLADQLRAGNLDVGLIPVAEYFQDLTNYRRVSNAVIACDGPVWSVRIFFRKAPSEVSTLAVDEGSRTSIALSKVLFHSKFGRVPSTTPLKIDEDPRRCDADAVLIIGDRAMHPENYEPEFITNWDLGSVWKEETGMPFVFAMWVARVQELATTHLCNALEASRDSGCDHVHEIAQHCAADYALSLTQCELYLSQFIRFHLGTRELDGLREFHRRCLALGLAPETTTLCN